MRALSRECSKDAMDGRMVEASVGARLRIDRTIEERPMIDHTSGVIQAALRGLAARQRLIAQNIANVNTPGYLASTVSFEDQLRSATSAGDPGAMQLVESTSSAPTGVNGNNVQLDDEMVELTETQLRYELMIQAMNSKVQVMRASIGRS